MYMGEFRVSLDDKGRLLLPTKLRADQVNSLVITRAVDNCLWLFPVSEWERISSSIMEAASPFQKRARMLQRRIIAPASELELDKAGRINVPRSLMEAAGLKKDCVLLGIRKYLELWDLDAYKAYEDETEQDLQEAAEELGGLISF